MDADTIAYLKQFIAATLRQQVSGLATKDDLAELQAELNRRFDEMQHDIAEALDASNETHHKQLRPRATNHQTGAARAA